VYPVTTGWVARQVYLGVAGRAAELPKLKRWMYGTIRKALETYAVRVGRGNGHGSPILWRLKPGDAVYASVIRKKKALAYAKHKRKRAEQA
jgi:hypothetical protein